VKRRPRSEFAGQTLRIKVSAAGIGGELFAVEDWCVNAMGQSWQTATANPAALEYAVRSSMQPGLPVDDEVLYGRVVGGRVYLVHVSELETGDLS
jgi:hypothetical protein